MVHWDVPVLVCVASLVSKSMNITVIFNEQQCFRHQSFTTLTSVAEISVNTDPMNRMALHIIHIQNQRHIYMYL